MAHALWNYDGPCRNIHGHSYKLFVTVIGQTNENTESTKLGMVMDFTDLKSIVNEVVIDVFDHSVVINNRAGKPDIQKVEQMFEKGLVKEVQSLLKGRLSKTAACAIGVKEIKDYLAGRSSLGQAKDLVKRHTRQYAKRQLTWFRKDKRITWINMANNKPGFSLTE